MTKLTEVKCEHSWVIKDGASQNETYKIAVCEKCLAIGKIQPRNEKPDVWAVKDRRITRMSVLKCATDIEVALITKVGRPYHITNILEIAQELESWVYREDK